MALRSGKEGVNTDQVDEFGELKFNDVSFKELTEVKIKLDEALLTASNFSDFKNSMLN